MGHVFEWIDRQLQQLEELNLRRHRRVRQTPQGAHIIMDGRPVCNFGSNDYLGLAAQLWPTAESTPCGWGSGASPMVTGYSDAHQQLEQAIADWERAEAALVFSSGYAANVGTVSALVSRGDVVFSDELNHASIIDGCRLSRAEVVVYPHADVRYLQQQLENSATYRRRLIVTDTLFSMEGDTANLEELAELAERFEAMLLVDEAHATGVYGQTGSGLVGEKQLENRIVLRVGTLSKALGCVGGFVVGPSSVLEWLAHRARSYFFSTALPDVCAWVACHAVQLARQAKVARQHLRELTKRVHEELRVQGWNLGRSTSHIVPVVIGEPQAALEAARRLCDRGLFVPAIRPPSVPQGRSLLRISLSAAHSQQDIDNLLDAMRELRLLVTSSDRCLRRTPMACEPASHDS